MWRYRQSQDNNDRLQHYGIQGQKWGVRRYQNEDGTLTEEGRKRYYGATESSQTNKYKNDWMGESELTRHMIRNKKSTNNGNKDVDTIADTKDYERALDKFDTIGQRTIAEYKKNGKDAAFNYLAESLKDYKYEYILDDVKSLSLGENYITYQLTLFGNKNVYSTSGEEEYTDDSWLTSKKEYNKLIENTKKALKG